MKNSQKNKKETINVRVTTYDGKKVRKINEEIEKNE